GVVPIAAGQSEEALKTINGLLRAGECVCLFPEGAISRNGHLGKFHTGYERTLEGVERGVIVPFYLHGLWGSSLSRAGEGLRAARTPDFRRRLIVAFGDALPLQTGAKALKQKVMELSLSAWRAYGESLESLPLAWLRAVKRDPRRQAIATVADGVLSGGELVGRVSALVSRLPVGPGERVGLLLPPGVDAVTAVLAALWRGLTLVPLDPGADSADWSGRLRRSGVRRVLTSRAVLAGLREADVDAATALADLLCLEDLRPGSGWLHRLPFHLLPAGIFYRLAGRAVANTQPAALLFDASGEAAVLTHRNLMVNGRQLSDVLNPRLDDVLVCSQPLDTAAGLVVGLLMPLVEGLPVLCHPAAGTACFGAGSGAGFNTGFDATGLARAIARFDGTVLSADPALLQALAEDPQVHPLLLENLRLVLCLGGSLDEARRQSFALRFGCSIYEGFGGVATTALASLNIPDAVDFRDWKVQQGCLPGSAGMPLPGTLLRIVGEGGEEAPLGQSGELQIGGAQVAAGRLDGIGHSGVTEDECGLRWLATGRRGSLNEEGFLLLVE
ncbi:MAG: AMP-binding protein, partial [Parahaliea sp.]